MDFKKLVAIAAFAIPFKAVAMGGATLYDYPALKENQWFDVYVMGMGNGIYATSLTLAARDTPYICIPNNVQLSPAFFRGLLDERYDGIKKMGDEALRFMNLETTLVFAMRSKYKCE